MSRHYWAEAAEAFTMIHEESGLIGIAGAAADKARAAQLLNIFCEHFAMLATIPVRHLAVFIEIHLRYL